MRLGGVSVPACHQLAVRAAHQHLVVVGQQRVGVPDVVEIAQDRLGRRGRADSPKMPLQKADPQHELRHRHGARVFLQTEKLMRIDARTGQREAVALAGEQVGERV